MKGLFIDTSRDPAILGLTEGPELITLECLESSKKLSSTFFPTLQSFCNVKALAYIAVGIGPGSYMGIRTAATVAKTLAFACRLPLIEFSSPLAFLPKGKEGTFAIVGDAKMGQLYILTGTAIHSKILDLSAPLLIEPEDLNLYTEHKDFIVGDNFLKPQPNLEWVVSQAYNQFIQGNILDPDALELIYLR